jgi:hypothetical protein
LPIHPLDLSPERPPDCLKPLYHGAAGVIWALRRLEGVSAAEPLRDFDPVVATLIDRSRDDLRRHTGVRDYMQSETPAYLVGDAGILLLQWTLAPSDAVASALAEAISARRGDTRGAVWGGAGAMLAAVFMYERTGDDAWRTIFLDHAEALLDAWVVEPDAGCRLWTQDLYGIRERRLGALHGAAANLHAVLRGGALLPTPILAEVQASARALLAATAIRDRAFANWPMSVGPGGAPGDALRVQHCIGAPGMINALAALPSDPRTDALLIAGGELTWRAGPVTKLPGLCHGAPGAGYAFLKLHRRTSEPVWLDRARAFAMHAITQADAARIAHGRRKWSLWTGDLGLAVFLQDCIDASAGFPTLDVF